MLPHHLHSEHHSSTFRTLFDADARYFRPLILFLLIVTSDHVVAARRFDSDQAYYYSDSSADPAAAAATHSNFFRSSLRPGRQRVRQRVVSCASDPDVCLDREKNPWGGRTCCFRKLCSDTLRDLNNCGACGRKCRYGFACCDGKCVDIRNDANHCGSCLEECPQQGKCSFAMCDYGG